MEKIKILIVDDEPLAREGVRVLLEQDSDVEVVGECANGREAVKALGELGPDLLFLDVQMPEMDGFEVLAQIDGGELTSRRTAGASALAASYLARQDVKRMVMVGAGRVAENLIPAHSSVRPIEQVVIWNRTHGNALKLAEKLSAAGLDVEASEDLEAAVREADLVSAATLAVDPLIRGEWLKPGTHVDLVGSFSTDVRESDDEVIRRATVFCDTREGAPVSSGDLAGPIAAGMLTADDIPDLSDLARGVHPGRTSDDEITVFKSVGASLEDFAAAVLVYEQVK